MSATISGPVLVAYGRTVSTPFGLLGNSENALTFALGYTLQQCPVLLRLFLRDIGIAHLRSDMLRSARIHLQRTSMAAGRDITDVEIHVPGHAHVILEAKIGLSVPSLAQCVKYLPRFRDIGEPRRILVALVESPMTDLVSRYRVEEPALDCLIGYQWARLIPHCVRLQARCPADTEQGRWVRAFRTFLEEEYAMKTFTEEVWIVPAQRSPLWPGGWSFYDTHVRGRIYYQPPPKYITKRPLYIALRTQGQVDAIQRVLRVEHDAKPVTYVTALENVSHQWPTSPHTIWHLSEPVPLPKAIPTGDATMRARHVSCDLDILLSSATIREAADRMRRRKQGLEGGSAVPAVASQDQLSNGDEADEADGEPGQEQ